MLRTKAALAFENVYNFFLHILYKIYDSLTYLVWFYCVAWFLNTGTEKFKLQSLLLNIGSHFFIAYRKLILNNAKAFIIFNPLYLLGFYLDSN